jgi:hypothetical protein
VLLLLAFACNNAADSSLTDPIASEKPMPPPSQRSAVDANRQHGMSSPVVTVAKQKLQDAQALLHRFILVEDHANKAIKSAKTTGSSDTRELQKHLDWAREQVSGARKESAKASHELQLAAHWHMAKHKIQVEGELNGKERFATEGLLC